MEFVTRLKRASTHVLPVLRTPSSLADGDSDSDENRFQREGDEQAGGPHLVLDCERQVVAIRFECTVDERDGGDGCRHPQERPAAPNKSERERPAQPEHRDHSGEKPAGNVRDRLCFYRVQCNPGDQCRVANESGYHNQGRPIAQSRAESGRMSYALPCRVAVMLLSRRRT
jgi:hypothetical protein